MLHLRRMKTNIPFIVSGMLFKILNPQFIEQLSLLGGNNGYTFMKLADQRQNLVDF